MAIVALEGLGFGSLDLSGVPPRRVVELARWGMAGKAPALRRHPRARRLATLLATVVYLEAKAIDDALELFDVLMVNDLMARAQRQSAAEKVRQYPRVSRDAARLAAAVGVLFESPEDEDVTLAEIWEAIDDVVPRSELRAALESIAGLTPVPQADQGGEWRALLVARYTVVRKFVPLLVRTIDFGATAEAAAVLDALRDLPDLMDSRATHRIPAGYLDEQLVALTFHLTSACDATSIGELLALACDKLDVKAPPLIAPALYLRVLVPLLGRLQPRRRTFLRAAATYVPYFAVRARFDDTRARAALGPQLHPKPLGEYYGKIIDYALRTRWGARPMSRCAAAGEAGVALDDASVGAGASVCEPEATGRRAG